MKIFCQKDEDNCVDIKIKESSFGIDPNVIFKKIIITNLINSQNLYLTKNLPLNGF